MGGNGQDTASFVSWGQGIIVDLVNQRTWDGAYTAIVSGIEDVHGTAFADVLAGDGGNNILTGGGGPDSLTGNGGRDTFKFTVLGD